MGMKPTVRNVSLYNRWAAVTFCLIVIPQSKVVGFLILYFLVYFVNGGDPPLIEGTPWVLDLIYHCMLVGAVLCLIFNGFGLRVRYYLNVVSSLLLYTMLVMAPFLIQSFESIYSPIAILPFTVLNGVALFKNYQSLVLNRKYGGELQ